MKLEDLFTEQQKEIIFNNNDKLLILKNEIKRLTYRLPFKEGDKVSFNIGSSVKEGVIMYADHYSKKYYINVYDKEGVLLKENISRTACKVWEGVKGSQLCKPCLFFKNKVNVYNAVKTPFILN